MFRVPAKSIYTAYLIIACCCTSATPFATSVGDKKNKERLTPEAKGDPDNWKEFRSVSGECTVSMPNAPEHVKQVMPLSDEKQTLSYDIYLSSFEKSALYMLLVAKYPEMVSKVLEGQTTDLHLESFLNGLLSQNPENRLIFADLVDTQGTKGLDFFIQSGTTYFKGRAVIAKNTLYLIAMECERKNYSDHHFKHFINSFTLKR
ncbi:MAG: hypothetical protein OXF02_04980 [Simkaniaceae bacterium]|nr:hypothetical protein [Simkaniaceae bacterium]